jgi:hypothetical protein
MAGLSNKDSSFFEIRSPDVEIDEQVQTSDLISLSVNEQMGQLTQGTITLYDPNMIYARILRLGVRLRLAWGYKDMDADPKSLQASIQNLDEFSGAIERRGLEAFIEAPTGSGTDKGVITYNANFTALGLRGDDQVRVFDTGTYEDVIRAVLTELGVPTGNQDIRFALGKTQITTENAVRQEESNFAFLTRLASREWRAFFAMNYDPKGQIHAIFVDPQILGLSPYQNAVMGTFGRSNLLDYKGLVNNVINYSWKNNAGRAGTGDSVQVLFVDGRPTFTRYNAETQTVTTWQLRPERIEAELERKGNDTGIQGQTAMLTDVLGAQSFEEVQRFFEPIEQTTAPQGYGYEVKVRMFGNPMIMAGNLVKFGEGFPDVLGSAQTNWYIRNVAHTINQSGYFMDVDVVDAYTFSPTGTVL